MFELTAADQKTVSIIMFTDGTRLIGIQSASLENIRALRRTLPKNPSTERTEITFKTELKTDIRCE